MYYVESDVRNFVGLFAEGLIHSDTQKNPVYGRDMYPFLLINVIIIINPPIWEFHDRQIIQK